MTLPADLRRVERAARRPRAGPGRHRPRPATRSVPASRSRSAAIVDRGRTTSPRPLGRRRRAPRRRRRACSGRRPRRPRAARSRRTSHARRGIASASSSAEVRIGAGRCGAGRRRRRPARSSPPGRASAAQPRGDARGDRRACSASTRARSTSRHRAATSPVTRARAGRSRRVAIATARSGPVTRPPAPDTLTGETRPLEPLEPATSSASTRCGPTVYGPAHVGNFRSFLFADLLVRHLRWRGLRGHAGS